MIEDIKPWFPVIGSVISATGTLLAAILVMDKLAGKKIHEEQRVKEKREAVKELFKAKTDQTKLGQAIAVIEIVYAEDQKVLSSIDALYAMITARCNGVQIDQNLIEGGSSDDLVKLVAPQVRDPIIGIPFSFLQSTMTPTLNQLCVVICDHSSSSRQSTPTLKQAVGSFFVKALAHSRPTWV